MLDPTPTPEPGTPNPGAFDPKAFSDSLLAEFNKGLNALDKKINGVMKALETKPPADQANPNPPAADPANPNPEPPKEAKTIAELNLRFERQQREIDAVKAESAASKKEKEEAIQGRLEAERVTAFDKVIQDIPFASPKARQQFRDAYLPKVVRDDDGAFVVNTDKGAIGYDQYLKAEAEDSPHLLAAQGSGGAGATGGKKPGAINAKVDVLAMTGAQIHALPAEAKATIMSDLVQQTFHPTGA